MLSGSVQDMRQRKRTARWDLARAVRARHSYAHRGAPLTDVYLLAVVMEALYFCLLARCSAAEAGVDFEGLMSNIGRWLAKAGKPPDWKPLILSGGRSMALAFG